MENNYPYEQLGFFYLGREMDFNGTSQEILPFLYKSRDLTTHAAIIGMTGSGKTGLGISLIEEAIMDNIPSIIIDPKGDMGNLLLSFPDLSGESLQPWIDPAEAAKKGKTIEQYADDQARTWKAGLQRWEQGTGRIAAMRRKTSFTIYTPGSSAGIPVSVLGNFGAPPVDVLSDGDTLNGLVNSLVTGLLSLVDIKAESGKSREYVLMSSIFLHSWRKGEDLDMETLIGNIVNPPFKKVGVFGLNTFYPQPDRMDLAMKLNLIIASPSFGSWMQGEPLNIQSILYDENGKPNTAIFSIAHLSESERMFFVTILLNRIIDWMRRQQGTSSLKALLYMDEIFGYFPPTANPPSKRPMLLLLKQARAYGIGVVLATQNPVDLDYKGLSNIGSWFVGRLQTTQDQDRVVDGIAGSSGGKLDKKTLRKLLSDMKGRQFLLRSAHLDEPLLFETRWVMSYLKGPISLPDIEKLMEERKSSTQAEVIVDQTATTTGTDTASIQDNPPLIADTVKQRYYLHPVEKDEFVFEPWLAARANVRFYNAKKNIDEITHVALRIYLDETFVEPRWQDAEEISITENDLTPSPPDNSSYYPLTPAFTKNTTLNQFSRSFTDYLYQNKRLELFRAEDCNLESRPGESQADFTVRLADSLREKKDEEVVRLEDQYRRLQLGIEKKIETALSKVEKEKADVVAKTTDTILSFGTAIMGAIFGRKSISVSTISRASTGIKNAGRLAREKGQVKQAEENVLKLQQELEAISGELEEKAGRIAQKYDIENYEVTTLSLKPRRSDIFDVDICLLWEMVS